MAALNQILAAHALVSAPSEDGDHHCHDLADRLKALGKGDFRRMGRGSKMALLSAWHCMKASGQSYGKTGEVAIFHGTGTGNAEGATTIYEDCLIHQAPSPFKFSGTIASMMNFYISKVLEIEGPSTLVTQEGQSFEWALTLALLSELEPDIQLALVGATDILTEFRPSDVSRSQLDPSLPLGEHSSWILLGREGAGKSLGQAEPPQFLELADLHHFLKTIPQQTQILLGLGMTDFKFVDYPHLQPQPYLHHCGHGLCSGAAAMALSIQQGRAGHYLHVGRDPSGLYSLTPFQIF